MLQISFGEFEIANRKKRTKRDEFLRMMTNIVPWDVICAIIIPFYHANQQTGRKPKSLIIMLKMYLLQLWFATSDEGTEDMIYDSMACQTFMGINFTGREQVPDSTCLEDFRHLIEAHDLADKIFKSINEILESQGLIMRGGTITDATIIDAPSSTKNAKKERDPEMKSTKKGNNYRFGGKIHTGTDAGGGAVVNVEMTAANEHDITQAHHCYREDDDVRYGDAAFIGAEKRPEIKEMDEANRDKRTQDEVRYETNKRPKSRTEKPANPEAINWEKVIEQKKSRVRCKCEHPFRIAKRIFGMDRCIYRGIAKNLTRAKMVFMSVNLYMFRERLRCC